jgi:hypothetical protein
MITIEGIITVGNPEATHRLSKTFDIPIAPYPELCVRVYGGVLIVQSVMTHEDKVYVQFKDQIEEGKSPMVELLMGDGWS